MRMTVWSAVLDVGVAFSVVALIGCGLWRLVQWARARSKRAYIAGALFAPFMAMGTVVDPDFRIVNEAKQDKKSEEDDPGDPPNDD